MLNCGAPTYKKSQALLLKYLIQKNEASVEDIFCSPRTQSPQIVVSAIPINRIYNV
jgi:hypothetical protein